MTYLDSIPDLRFNNQNFQKIQNNSNAFSMDSRISMQESEPCSKSGSNSTLITNVFTDSIQNNLSSISFQSHVSEGNYYF